MCTLAQFIYIMTASASFGIESVNEMHEFHIRPSGSNGTVAVRLSVVVWPVHSTHRAAVHLHCLAVHKEAALRVDGAAL